MTPPPPSERAHFPPFAQFPRISTWFMFLVVVLAPAFTPPVRAIETRLPLFAISVRKPSANDGFGSSLAISPSGLLAVGATEYHWAPDAGVVRVFDLSTRALLRTIGNPAPYGEDRFGWSLAFAGSSLFVASYRDDEGKNLLRFHTAEWQLGPALSPVPAERSRVAGEGSTVVARDGTNVLVFASSGGQFLRSFPDLSGAPSEAPLVLREGLVAIANGTNDTVWIADLETGAELHVVSNPDPARYGGFAESIDLRGGRLLVGAADGWPPATDGVFLFDVANPVAPLVAEGPGLHVGFGEAVALTEAGELVVGAPRMPNLVGGVGLARLHTETGEPLVDFIPDRPAPSFGEVIATLGNRVVVAAPQATAECCAGAGMVFVYRGTAPEPEPSPVPEADCGDVDGDGVVDSADLLIRLLGERAP